MLGLGAPEIVLLIVAALLFFGYKKLPEASRSLGRSLRIFKGEMKGMKDDDAAQGVRTRDAATTTPVRGEIAGTVPSAGDDLTAQLEEEARRAEARAAELRARAEQARSGSADGIR
ncbi:MAG: tatA [Blastococcus sp.]|jgi:sec-independent protein translocase protein TatA|nr:tatA [Blastococcus sp.]